MPPDPAQSRQMDLKNWRQASKAVNELPASPDKTGLP